MELREETQQPRQATPKRSWFTTNFISQLTHSFSSWFSMVSSTPRAFERPLSMLSPHDSRDSNYTEAFLELPFNSAAENEAAESHVVDETLDPPPVPLETNSLVDLLPHSLVKGTSDSAAQTDTETAIVPLSMGTDHEGLCLVCWTTPRESDLPRRPPTFACDHPANVCIKCLAICISTQMDARIWDHIYCPECDSRLEYFDIKEHADSATFERYVLNSAHLV